MFSFGGSEFLIIVLVALLLFGPDKIPHLARTIGRFTREFNKYKAIMENTIAAEVYRADGKTTDEMSVSERIAKAGAASDAISEAKAEAAAAAAAEVVTVPETPADVLVPEPEPAIQPTAARRQAPVPSADEADEEDEV